MGVRLVVLGAVLAVGLSAGSTVAGASVAAADQLDCAFYLHFEGYGGKIVDIGCAYGAQGDQVVCEGSSRIAGVPEDIGREACRLAALP